MLTQRQQPVIRLIIGACLASALALVSACASTSKADNHAKASGEYAFWPTFPDDPHIQFARSINSSADISNVKSSGLEKLVFGKDANKSAGINKPYGVAMRDGKIYVCDIRNNCIEVMDLRKKEMRLVGVSGVNQLKRPVAVAVADDGTIYAADIDRGAILVFDASEHYSRAYGHPNFKPTSLAVHGDRLYATDMNSQLVEVYDRNDGRALGTIGTVGDEDGQFRLPLGVATDPQGNVYVMDMMRCRLQKFTPEGKFQMGVGAVGKVAGTFARPKHIAVDSDGVIYIVDAAFQNVQMFSPQAEFLMHFGAVGDFPGQMNLPAGICVCEDSTLDLFKDLVHPGFKPKRLIAVTNQFGEDKVSIYVEGDLREGYTAQDLAKAAASVKPGTGLPTAEDAKLAAPGGEEPKEPSQAEEQPKAGTPPVKQAEPK
jgi:DNA-binding beta-propeller fold protein YncE